MSENATPYSNLLRHNVPRFIQHIRERGGVSEEEWVWVRCDNEGIDYPEGILSRADEYLLYPKDEKTFNKGLFTLVKLLAIMAFVPLGIRLFGLHFCSEIEGFVATDD